MTNRAEQAERLGTCRTPHFLGEPTPDRKALTQIPHYEIPGVCKGWRPLPSPEARPTWICDNCGNIEHREREVSCWKCHKGQMIYHTPSFAAPSGQEETSAAAGPEGTSFNMRAGVSKATMFEFAASLLRSSMPQAAPLSPNDAFGYAYRYPDGIRLGTNGRDINGCKPSETIPLYTKEQAEAYAAHALREKEQEIERCVQTKETWIAECENARKRFVSAEAANAELRDAEAKQLALIGHLRVRVQKLEEGLVELRAELVSRYDTKSALAVISRLLASDGGRG